MSQFSDIEAIIQQGLNHTAPAIAVAIYSKGELVADHIYGFLDPETRLQPAMDSTLFDLASVTKLFTATAFLIQTADNKVQLDDPVVSVIPEFGVNTPRAIEGGQNPHTLEREGPTADPSQTVDPGQITFRHLLTHTSGLAPWRDIFAQVGPIPPPPGETDTLTRQQRINRALELIGQYPFVDVPGYSVRYSDLGLILLGEAVARLDNVETPAEAITDRILKPANLHKTTFNPTNAQVCVPTEYDQRWRGRRCQGEVHDENACALGGVAGHAGLFSTAAEVARFGQLWLENINGTASFWLPRDLALQGVREQTAGEYRGLGWLLKSPQGSSAGHLYHAQSFGHTGFTGTSLWIDPVRELVTALLTNRVYWGRDSEAIVPFRQELHTAICQYVDTL